MKYESKRGLTFTIEELNAKEQKAYESKYIAMQDLTKEQKNNPNFLREVYIFNTIKELEAKVEGWNRKAN